MRLVVTGADGFLGWHLRCRLAALTDHEVIPVGRDGLPGLVELSAGADAIVHLAGANRAPDDEVEQGNIELAHLVADAAKRNAVPRVVFANSIQHGNGTPYGTGKARAAELLSEEVRGYGGSFVDVRLPNLFGEHGRPRYNSFVATFAHAVVNGDSMEVADREIELLHAQGAAAALIEALTSAGPLLLPAGHPTTVLTVLETLRSMNALYNGPGDIPPLPDQFQVDLFNTLRSVLFPTAYPMGLPLRSDARGDLVECVKAHGGQGQTFVSSTNPGFTRGEHYHLTKVERFLVLRGTAQISLRRMFSEEIVRFDVSGEQPALVDMPTMWVHNITNTGNDELITLFWTHTVFDPDNTDTFPEPVEVRIPGSGS